MLTCPRSHSYWVAKPGSKLWSTHALLHAGEKYFVLYNPVSSRCLTEVKQATRRRPWFQKPLAVAMLVCPPAGCPHAATTIEVPSLSGQVGAKTTSDPLSLSLKQPLEFRSPGSSLLHSSQAIIVHVKSTAPFQAVK